MSQVLIKKKKLRKQRNAKVNGTNFDMRRVGCSNLK